MFCRSCGRQIPDGSEFCKFCGASVKNFTPEDIRREKKTVKAESNNVATTPNTLVKSKKYKFISIVLGVLLLVSVVIGVASYLDVQDRYWYQYNRNESLQFDIKSVIEQNQNLKELLNAARDSLAEAQAQTSEPKEDIAENSKMIVFDGTVGGSPIVMSLTIEGEGVTGYYYNKNFGSKTKITLYGKMSFGSMILYESIPGIENPGTFDGNYEGSSFTGQYYLDGKQLTFALGRK